MKIQYVSDLHLDVSNIDINCDKADVLVIAGDLCSSPSYTHDWILENISNTKPVIYVSGNHEYDYQDISIHDKTIKESLADLPNVHYLNNESVVIDDVKFIGSTLWTGFDAFPEMGNISDIKRICARSISDFSVISNADKKFSPDDAMKLYKDAKSFIFSELTNSFEGKKVVVTHFPPTLKSLHKMYRDNLINPYFITNCEDLVVKSDLWIHGHTHTSVNANVYGVKVLCNPRGYSKLYNFSENPAWNPNKTVRI